jgi:hypothetical protein
MEPSLRRSSKGDNVLDRLIDLLSTTVEDCRSYGFSLSKQPPIAKPNLWWCNENDNILDLKCI